MGSLFILGCSPADAPFPIMEASRVQPRIVASISGIYPKGFEIGDKIGVFPVYYNSEGEPGILGNDAYPLHIPFTYNGRIWLADADKALYLEDVPVDVYAYWPYCLVDEATDPQTFPFDLSGDQNEREVDFLWAKAENISGKYNTAGLIFQHVLSRVEINLYYEDPQEVPELKLKNTYTQAYIDLSTGMATFHRNIQEDIRPKWLSGISGDKQFSYEAIIVPQQLTKDTPFLSVRYEGETMYFVLPEDMLFEPQYNYVFNIVIGTAKENESVRRITPQAVIKVVGVGKYRE
ncbi:fimbrillin family protein [Parabacteroides sp. PFB2-10]|uniref:fimbrillin family protein n=1 Tax=Parabacteroides sp. PFB2-10 TaxID=1742405 RepID=UPI002476F353|nr:fimbrillin family protein [Parabacteroides sp. PFB2-10]MDL2245166.1 fimbrillin family protein [Parabacteroides sp. OttesenSCG-928-J18]